jgi:hypothetical protein
MIENLVTAFLVVIAAAYLAVRIRRSLTGRPCECKAEKCPYPEGPRRAEKCPHAHSVANNKDMS